MFVQTFSTVPHEKRNEGAMFSYVQQASYGRYSESGMHRIARNEGIPMAGAVDR